jgi:hypothetical protein
VSERHVTHKEELETADKIRSLALASMVEVESPELRIQAVVYNKKGHVIWMGMLGAATLNQLLPGSKNGIPIGRT